MINLRCNVITIRNFIIFPVSVGRSKAPRGSLVGWIFWDQDGTRSRSGVQISGSFVIRHRSNADRGEAPLGAPPWLESMDVVSSRAVNHIEKKCRKKQADAEKRFANLIEETEVNENPVLLTCNVAEESSKDVWFVDSSCSNHMTGNIELFIRFDKSIQSKVKLGNDCKVSVNGKGVIVVYDINGERRTVDDVYYVHGLKYNLLSVR